MAASLLNHSLAIKRSPTGSVLIVVLVVCLGLVSIALLFGHSMLLAYRGSDDDLAGRQAEHACEGAARYAEYLLANVTNDGDLPQTINYQTRAVPVGDAFFSLIGVPQLTDPSGNLVYGLVDEASKLNLNTVSVTTLEHLPNMTQDLAEAIVDWRSSGGAAAAQTSGAGAGISATSVKEAPFESVEELAQIDGGTNLTILYGNDNNLNHVLDAWEDTGNGQLAPGLLEYVTAFSREPKLRRDGTERVDVTGTKPFEIHTGAGVVTGLTGSNALSTLLNSTFPGGRGPQLLRATYAPANGTPARAVTSVLEFYIRSGMTATELAQISPYLTLGTGTYKAGLVNVNTASQTVLACLPGMTYQLAGQLVAARSQLSAPSSDLSWVYPILGRAPAIEAGRYLTTRSYQVTADVAATGRHGHGYRRTQYVIDSSTGTPQIAYRRDLSSLGWALGVNGRPPALTNGGAH